MVFKNSRRKNRVNWTLDPAVYNTLKEAAKKNGRSMSQIVEHLVNTHVADRRKVIESEKRLLAKRMYELDQELELIDVSKK